MKVAQADATHQVVLLNTTWSIFLYRSPWRDEWRTQSSFRDRWDQKVSEAGELPQDQA